MGEISEKIQFYAEFAGITGRFACNFEQTREFCKDYLIEPCEPAMEADISLENINEIRRISEKTDINEGRRPIDYPDYYLEQLALHKAVSDRMPAFNRVLFHCSSLQINGEAVAFAAPSGTGKSTHVRLWKEVFGDEVKSVNDDKPFMGLENGRVHVFGSPWQGKHNLGENVAVPLKAIGIIVRDTENKVVPVKPADAVVPLLAQTHRPTDTAAMIATMQVLKAMAETVPIYEIHCNMDPEAARVSRDGLFKDACK